MKITFLESFADALEAKFSLPGSASPEDQLKPVVADLMKSAGTDYGLTVDTRTETLNGRARWIGRFNLERAISTRQI